MLEPVAAIGLAASIIQLFNFVKDILSNSYKIYASADGMLVENTDLESICKRLDALCLQMQKHEPEVRPRKSAHGPSEAESQLQLLSGEARARAKELMQMLESLKTTSKGSAWESVRKALASAAKSKDLELLEDRLGRVRGQIDSALVVALRESVEKLHAKQYSSAQETNTHLDVLARSLRKNHQLLQQIRQAQSTNTKLGPIDIPYYLPSELLSTTVGHQEEAFSNSCKSQILAQIEFEDMLDRQEAIPEAHRQTFNWLFQGNNDRPGAKIHEVRPYPEMEVSASHTPPPHSHPIVWRDFGRWLESDEKLYWITGKPGAGKSTLMKFLQHDPRTRRLAQRWATRLSNSKGSTAPLSEPPSSKLHMASFFFWIAGSDLQKSEEGLRRSLLHQLLAKDPEQIRDVYPKRMQRHELFGGDRRAFTHSEHKRGLETLFQQRAYPILLFIDGLDEIHGNTTELAKLIKRWSSLPQVKICVASRPWTVFESAFESMPTLQIEWLTRQDIERYVKDHFNASMRFVEMRQHMEREAEELLKEVANRACGVFLWVYVVVASLLEGLTDGDSIADLRQRLQDLPIELEELFDRILDRANPSYAAQASEIFQFLRECPDKSTLIGVYHAQLPLEDALAAEIGVYEPGKAQYFASVMRRRIYSRCNCFIETVGRYTHSSKLRYLHRTAMDYLHQPHVWQKIVSKQPSYNIGLARSTWRLMHTKKSQFSTEVRDEKLWALMHNPDIFQIKPVAMRVSFLDEVYRIGESFVGSKPSADGSSSQVSTNWLSLLRSHMLRSHMEKRKAEMPPAVSALRAPQDMFDMALAFGYDWYVSAKVQANKELLLRPIKAEAPSVFAVQHYLGSGVAVAPLAFAVQHDLGRVKTVLLEHGADLNPLSTANTPPKDEVDLRSSGGPALGRSKKSKKSETASSWKARLKLKSFRSTGAK